jgi:hypothetical protein
MCFDKNKDETKSSRSEVKMDETTVIMYADGLEYPVDSPSVDPEKVVSEHEGGGIIGSRSQSRGKF